MRIDRYIVAAFSVVGATLALMPPALGASAALGQLGDPVALNIGLNCHWNHSCMSAQKSAMKKSLKYVDKYDPPQWRIHLCNRNASRISARVDWVGFDRCVRNESLRPPPPPPPPLKKKYKKRRP